MEKGIHDLMEKEASQMVKRKRGIPDYRWEGLNIAWLKFLCVFFVVFLVLALAWGIISR